jgi:hypothetical protein
MIITNAANVTLDSVLTGHTPGLRKILAGLSLKSKPGRYEKYGSRCQIPDE